MARAIIIQYICLFFVVLISFAAPSFAEEEPTPFPDIWQMPTYIYEDYITAYDRVFDEEAIPYWWAVGLSTAVLLATDDKWISESKRLGKKWGLSTGDTLETYVSIGGQSVFRAPTDTGSWMYYIGDGWTHSAIAAGFLATGAWTDNDKTYGVGFELIEGMITTTIATQFLKHITGHDTPNTATKPRGRWDFFPNQQDYMDCVPCYDAFPSGHLAVGSMTLTVIHKNYPDNPWVMPVGVTLLSALSFQMMNNGVHWASDYPVAIALGYTFGSIAYERGQRALERASRQGTEVSSAQWIPIFGDGVVGLGVYSQF